MPEFYIKDLGDVTKIVIVKGSTGNKKTIVEKAVIEGFLTKIKEIKFIPEENQEERKGWSYSIRLYEDAEKTFQNQIFIQLLMIFIKTSMYQKTNFPYSTNRCFS
ncbi:hypothetical protein [Bacillus sp. X1(2014)]|uniref:hypothetical protein n=1 Tax=Bacillus sp. X1(2014) TaxID=1565991 RepID=UPI0021B48ED1|nr:hypothetical protein [Bacillus sp. X1(2014)]